jgi:hypothetical protein
VKSEGTRDKYIGTTNGLKNKNTKGETERKGVKWDRDKTSKGRI